jgi:hypothetical protein
MSVFKNLKSEGLEKSEDRVGGFGAMDADAYKAKITLAYAGESSGGATSVTLHADINGREYRETFYVTNRKGENFFLNKSDTSKKVGLPGFTVVNDICFVTTEKSLSEQDTEEKIVKLYDYDEKKEMPKSVPVMVDLIGKELSLGILNILENKSVKDNNGQWADGPDEQNINVVDKVFHEPTRMTVNEATSEKPEALFYDSWVERNKGKVRDKRTIKDGQAGTAGRPGASKGAPAATEAGERKSLFGG